MNKFLKEIIVLADELKNAEGAHSLMVINDIELLYEKHISELKNLQPIEIKDDDILILLKRNFPTTYEIHRGEIDNAKNLILTTSDKDFAVRLVKGYNDSFNPSSIENFHCGVCGHKEFREDEDL